MKPLLEVEATRISYHQSSSKNTVHRSSLLVPRFEQSATFISFLNHFLLKRNNDAVVIKISAYDGSGNMIDSVSSQIFQPKVYTYELENYFDNSQNIKEYQVEFYSNKNLYIPFPAVMVNHVGFDFVNCIHAYNRILNDVFEDDKVNHLRVFESSVEVLIDDEYDTFFNFATGPFDITDNIQIDVIEDTALTKIIPVTMSRFCNRNFYLSELGIRSKKATAMLKILQPSQTLFYGRLLAGKVNKNTKSFSANHSYYDCSNVEEYFDSRLSARTYPYFANCSNRIVVYPIMSPSSLNIYIELYCGDSVYKSDVQILNSPSNSSIIFDIDELKEASGFSNVNLFKVIAESKTDRIPTRVNHQLLYGEKFSNSKLHCSINVSLENEKIYIPKFKSGLTWGQVLVKKGYESRIGVCFKNNYGDGDEVTIDFYGNNGKITTLNSQLHPSDSLIYDTKLLSSLGESSDFVWFIAKSKREDLQAISFHYNVFSGNASGEHSF